MSDAEDENAEPIPFDAERAIDPTEIVPPPRLPRVPGEPLWVFGYGSLMWDPGFPFGESRVALLRGYHRAFCVYSHHYRGTPAHPGLVLGLKRGGSCRGRAFRVDRACESAVIDYLYRREMLTGVYRPAMLPAITAEGAITALAFVANPLHQQYAGSLSETAIIDRIRHARGTRGPCRDYLLNTVHHLEDIGIRDAALHRLLRAVEAG
jgi:cation transport protein ChaC